MCPYYEIMRRPFPSQAAAMPPKRPDSQEVLKSAENYWAKENAQGSGWADDGAPAAPEGEKPCSVRQLQPLGGSVSPLFR